jgi:rsbT co-antagonist protein RsbR
MAYKQEKPSLLQTSAADLERRRRIVDLDDEDTARILSLKEVVMPQADRFAAAFFDYLGNLEEAESLFRNRELLDEARRRKREHLVAMVGGEYGHNYVEQRIGLGRLYSRIGLEVRVFLGAFHHLMHSIGTEVMERYAGDPADAFERFMSLKKVSFFDVGVIVDVLIDERERTIALQQQAIRELSTPVLQVRDRLLILPLIGVVDTRRAKQMTDDLLRAIRANRAKVVVMDVTGVAAVDSKVANHFLQTVAAARLMGTIVIVTGLSADVAQSLVTLGVDLDKLNTVGDLQGGLEEAERLLGYRVALVEGRRA